MDGLMWLRGGGSLESLSQSGSAVCINNWGFWISGFVGDDGIQCFVEGWLIKGSCRWVSGCSSDNDLLSQLRSGYKNAYASGFELAVRDGESWYSGGVRGMDLDWGRWGGRGESVKKQPPSLRPIKLWNGEYLYRVH
ncbi:hypothetical protein Tco_0802143 [Tanacetum coccineum]|uniref:Uncharacterized protein n=1 Tax=Tanacetum coccineum TaxID=301880 RepID=A0ABQ4ZXY8_9ASTR